jgi:hypothetical protein
MSIQISKLVWDGSKSTSGTLLVLLAIADHADKSGMAYPGIPRLARMARLSTRQVKRAVKELESLGELQVIRGAGRKGTNVYYVKVRLTREQWPMTSEVIGSDKDDRKPVTSTSPKPSFNRQRTSVQPKRWEGVDAPENVVAIFRKFHPAFGRHDNKSEKSPTPGHE